MYFEPLDFLHNSLSEQDRNELFYYAYKLNSHYKRELKNIEKCNNKCNDEDDLENGINNENILAVMPALSRNTVNLGNLLE